MNVLSTLAARAATVSAMLVIASIAPGTANPAPPSISPVRERSHAVRRTTTGCMNDQSNTDGSNYFVAITAAQDYADASLAVTLGGDAAQTCAPASIIAAGANGLIELQPSVQDAFIGAGSNNVLNGTVSFLGAGGANVVSGDHAFVGGGYLSDVSGEGAFSGGGGAAYVLNGGQNQQVSGNSVGGEDAFAGAGDLLRLAGPGNFGGGGGYLYATSSAKPTQQGNQTGDDDSFGGGGDSFYVASNQAFVGGGNSNEVATNSSFTNALGGYGNFASSEYASILGGYDNKAGGEYDIVAGGNSNAAHATLDFVAGYHASTQYAGSFVWGDYASGNTPVRDSATNQVVTRASGGTYLYSNEGVTSGVALTPGSGTWANLSDRRAKIAIVPVDGDAILAKVTTLPVDTWQYETERGVRHVGPMAQDFAAAFGTGADDRHITSIDEDGVALAAIKALDAKVDRSERAWNCERHTLVGDRQAARAGLAARLSHLEAEVDALSKR